MSLQFKSFGITTNHNIHKFCCIWRPLFNTYSSTGAHIFVNKLPNWRKSDLFLQVTDEHIDPMTSKKKIAKKKQFTRCLWTERLSSDHLVNKWLEITEVAGEIKVGLRWTYKKNTGLNLQWPDQLHNLDASCSPSKDDCTIFLGNRYQIWPNHFLSCDVQWRSDTQ